MAYMIINLEVIRQVSLVVFVCMSSCFVYGALAGGEAKTAQVKVTVSESASSEVLNTTYLFGIYGKKSDDVEVTGHLVHVQSEGGANHGCTDYNHDLPNHDWVALIERGECYFSEKIRMATQQYNATAVIVYDNRESIELVSMHASVEDEVYIFMKQSMGRRLAQIADQGLYVHVNITPIDAVSSSAPTTSTPISVLHTLVVAAALLWTFLGLMY